MPEKETTLNIETFDNLKKLMGSNFTFLLQEYLKSAENFIIQIQSATANNNTSELATAAHPLKSSSAQIGAVSVRDIAEKIELAAQSGGFPEGSDESFTHLLSQLETSFSDLKATLSPHVSFPG